MNVFVKLLKIVFLCIKLLHRKTFRRIFTNNIYHTYVYYISNNIYRTFIFGSTMAVNHLSNMLKENCILVKKTFDSTG